MKLYFEDFEEQLKLVGRKLQILLNHHLASGQSGAADITSDCLMTIADLWVSFDELSSAYSKAEASHEEFFNSNVNYLLGEMRKYDNEILEDAIKEGRERPGYLLFNYLDKEQRLFEDPNTLSWGPEYNIWRYIRSLIIKDQIERGIL